MRRTRFFTAILGGILAGSLAPLGVAGADGSSAAICSWTGQATFSPGLTFTPQRGTLQFQGQSGSIDCQGTISVPEGKWARAQSALWLQIPQSPSKINTTVSN